MGRRSGASLVDLLAALVLFALLAMALIALLQAQSRWARQLSARAEVLDAVRTTAVAITTELAPLDVAVDLYASAPESLAMRVFRGAGIVCDTTGGSALLRYRGWRDPDPTKDSLLVLDARGERAQPLRAASGPLAPSCTLQPGEEAHRVTSSGPLLPGTLALVFESGAYHLSAGALRYRRGAGTRQPVTADVLQHDSSNFTLETAVTRASAVRLRVQPARAAAERAGVTVWPALSVRLPLVNRPDSLEAP
jgi:hypothetical protein